MTSKRKVSTLYTFPLQMAESVRFETTGAYVDKATLMVNGRILSVIRPQYDDFDEAPPARMLTFFRDKPFHGALANGVDVKITLEVSDGRIPSVVFHILNNSLTWPDVGSTTYKEDVFASSDSGECAKEIMYIMNQGVGYIRRPVEAKPSTNNTQIL